MDDYGLESALERGVERVRCVGALVRDDAGRLLVVLRGQEPSAGTWSLPGGRVEPGETDGHAVAREVQEETGLVVRPADLVGTVERPGPGDVVYAIFDYRATVVTGRLRAASDAADARWVTENELLDLPCAPGLLDTLRSWQELG
ncbi:MAG: NUDIX hydrolase [Nocardioidaceae bacterium]